MLLRSGERVSDRLLAAQQGRGLARRSNFRYFVIVFGLHAASSGSTKAARGHRGTDQAPQPAARRADQPRRNGASPIAVTATAGHRSMQTTKQCLHLASVTFEQDAAALETRVLAGRNFYPTDVDLG